MRRQAYTYPLSGIPAHHLGSDIDVLTEVFAQQLRSLWVEIFSSRHRSLFLRVVFPRRQRGPSEPGIHAVGHEQVTHWVVAILWNLVPVILPILDV
jgi:hypothetical protein